MLRTLLLSVTLSLVAFSASATDRFFTSNNNGGRILVTDEHTAECQGQWYRAHVDNTKFEGCFTLGIYSASADTHFVLINWNAEDGNKVLVVYPAADFEAVPPVI